MPPVREAQRNIDWFIERKLSGKNIEFSREADRLTLARRLALTLTGLPLDPERAQAFAAEQVPDAYERLVDELLASKRFGEHQARYWLDAVRYADTHGLHKDNRRAIFPYRDWVIRAFNNNLPMNFFIKWQVAGDLIGGTDRLIATGFVRLNPTTSEGGTLSEEYQAVNTFDRVETLGTALLGMTLSCARCHDHKYDPISQKDYFRLFAYFNNTADYSLDKDAYRYDPVIMVPRDAEQRARRAAPAKSDLTHGLPALPDPPRWSSTNWLITKVQDVAAPKPADDRFFVIRDLPGRSRQELPPTTAEARWLTFTLQLPRERVIWLRYGSAPGHELYVSGVRQTNTSRYLPLHLQQGNHRVDIKLVGSADLNPLEVYLRDGKAGSYDAERWTREVRRAAFEDEFVPTLVAEERESPRPTRVLKRGQYDRPVGDPLLPGIPPAFGTFNTDLPTNRLGLALWLTDRENPLVARVLANRVWQQVFGAGLVRTPEDFGARGEAPTHPELLDWLAVELMDSGWNFKRLVKAMVSSRTFRQASIRRTDLDDPENRLWARGPRYRFDAEMIRDVGLWTGGILDLRMGGEGVKPWQPAGLWKALSHPESNTRIYEPDPDELTYRRSVYLYWKRSSPHPMMTLFDAPTREASCVRRSRSNTPAQSLALLNERHRVEMAQALARRLVTEPTNKAKIERLYWLLTGRAPRESEREACAALLEKLGESEPWPKLVIAVMASDAAITLN